MITITTLQAFHMSLHALMHQQTSKRVVLCCIVFVLTMLLCVPLLKSGMKSNTHVCMYTTRLPFIWRQKRIQNYIQCNLYVLRISMRSLRYLSVRLKSHSKWISLYLTLSTITSISGTSSHIEVRDLFSLSKIKFYQVHVKEEYYYFCSLIYRLLVAYFINRIASNGIY